MLGSDTYIETVAAAVDEIAAVAAGNLHAPVEHCPGFDVGRLLEHTGGFARIVAGRVARDEEWIPRTGNWKKAPADEVAGDYRTLMKYLPADQWTGWRHLPVQAMASLLAVVAQHVNLKGLTRSRRGPKKPPQQKPVYDKKHKHYSTARLLKDLDQEDTC